MFKKIIFTGMLMAAFANANAQTAAFGMTGTVMSGVCSVTLTGGQINLGTRSTATVKAYSKVNVVYQSPALFVPLNITCSAPTMVVAAFADNQTGKTFPMDAYDSSRFGMVDGAGTTSIGAFEFFFTGTTIDAITVGQYLTAPNGSTTWTATGPGTDAGVGHKVIPAATIGFAKSATAVAPEAFTTLNSSLLFVPLLSTAYVGSATAPITPTGSGTLTLVYL